MSITIIATSGGTTSNSFVTLAEADTYLEAHLQASEWSAFDDEQKKAAIVAATREINQLPFAGRRSTKDQSLAWPRSGIVDYDGYAVSDIPNRLKDAVCELAVYRLTEDDRIAGDFELENLSAVEIGPIKYTVRTGADTGLPPVVRSLLNAIGPAAAGSTSAKQMVL